MAGVEVKKYEGGSMGDADIHFDLDKREVCDHSNRAIDKSLVKDDYYIGASSWSDIKKKMRDIIKDADEKHPPKRVRKDRKLWFTVEMPCPPELEGTDKEDLFFKRSYEVLSESLPLVGAEIHKDEKHEYWDPKKEAFMTSLNHMHAMGPCLTKDGRINAHDLLTQELCQKINDDIQKMCLREFGISYQTGAGRKGSPKKTVEELKNESQASLEAKLVKDLKEEQKAITGAVLNMQAIETKKEAHIEELTSIEDQKTSHIEELDSIITMNEQIITQNDEHIQTQNQTISKNDKHIEGQEKKKEELAQEITKAQRFFDELCGNLMTRFLKAYDTIARIMKWWFDRGAEEKQDEIAQKADPIIEKGTTAIKNINSSLRSEDSNSMITREDMSNLKSSAKDLEELADMEELRKVIDESDNCGDPELIIEDLLMKYGSVREAIDGYREEMGMDDPER